jgi:hypothetical protein
VLVGQFTSCGGAGFGIVTDAPFEQVIVQDVAVQLNEESGNPTPCKYATPAAAQDSAEPPFERHRFTTAIVFGAPLPVACEKTLLFVNIKEENKTKIKLDINKNNLFII